MKNLVVTFLLLISNNSISQDVLNFEKLKNLPNQTEIAIGIYSGDTITKIGFSLKNKDLRRSNNSHKLFEIGSITKLFTTCLTLKVFAEKSLSIESKLNQFVPIPNLNEISIKNLLSHTAGLPKMPNNFIWSAIQCPKNPFLHYCENRMLNYLTRRKKFESRPNEKYSYSNLGFGLMGYILSKIENDNLVNLYTDEIFNSLDMRNTSLGLSEANYELVPKSKSIKGKPRNTWEFTEEMAAAGSIYSNVNDMLKFLEVIINKDSKDQKLNSALLKMNSGQFEIENNEHVRLGWKNYSNGDTDIIYHGGITMGFKSFIAVDEKGKNGIIVLTNANGLTSKVNLILKAFCLEFLTQKQ